MDDRPVTAVTTIGLAGDLAALEPRAGEAREAVSRARDWLLAASMKGQGSLPEELHDDESAYVPVLACRRAAEDLEQARDGVPPDAVVSYDEALSAIRRIAPPVDVLCTPEHKRLLAEHEAWEWGHELAQQHWPRQWRDSPATFVNWIEDERQRLGAADATEVMKAVRDVAGQSDDDYEAAAAYMVETYSYEDITAQARAYWLAQYEDDEEFARRLSGVNRFRYDGRLDAMTALVALRIEAVWRDYEPGGGSRPHGAGVNEDTDVVRAVAEDTWWMADRLWKQASSRWPECSSELARALGPLAAAVKKWQAEAGTAGQREG